LTGWSQPQGQLLVVVMSSLRLFEIMRRAMLAVMLDQQLLHRHLVAVAFLVALRVRDQVQQFLHLRDKGRGHG
jgi:hypothetical protein